MLGLSYLPCQSVVFLVRLSPASKTVSLRFNSFSFCHRSRDVIMPYMRRQTNANSGPSIQVERAKSEDLATARTLPSRSRGQVRLTSTPGVMHARVNIFACLDLIESTESIFPY